MAHNWKWYIDNNDLEGCYRRFEQARSNWKDHWWETIESIYNSCGEWAKQYILDPIARTITKITAKVKKSRASKYDTMINSQDFNIKENGKEFCYLFEFYDENDNFLCSKVGTTTRTVRERLIEELRSKTYKNMGAAKVIIHRVYDCGNLPAEGLESLIRSQYIKKYPNSFKKNDRFVGQYFDFDFCDSLAKNYLGMA